MDIVRLIKSPAAPDRRLRPVEVSPSECAFRSSAVRAVMASTLAFGALNCAGLATALADPATAAATPQATTTQAGADGEFVAKDVSASASSGPSSGNGPTDFLNGISRSANLLGPMWGLRPLLSKGGMTFTLEEQSEMLGNVTGGTGKQFDYDGLTTATLQLDTERAFGLHGGTFNVSGLWTHGRNLSTDTLQTLQTSSGIEADRSYRLWELWYDQKFLENDSFDVKIGQQSIDQEFMVSQNAGLFVNTMFGWPMLPSANMPGGGPAYPLSALGVRGRVKLTDSLSLLAGIYNGSPLSSDGTDKYGTSFPLNGGVLAIAEVQFAYPNENTVVKADEDQPLSRVYKLGVWYDSETFDDLRTGTDGLSLADPNSNGIPVSHKGNYAIYAVADQMIWRDPAEADRNINVFIRPMFTTMQDRNLISYSVNAGVVMHEPFLGRDDDTVGLGMGLTRVSDGARGFDADTAALNPGTYSPVRGTETYFEATYSYEVTPAWQIQPDIQYIINPGAGIANASDPTTRVKNELVLGARTTLQF